MLDHSDLVLRFGRCLKDGALRRGQEVLVHRSALTTPHFAILGVTGSGKSTLVEDLVDQLLLAGEGVTVIDPGNDLANNIAARFAARVMESGDTGQFDRFHWLEPGSYSMLFGLDPAAFDPTKPIGAGDRENAYAAWKHAAVQTFGELIQLKQGQMDFEQNARLHRVITRALSAAYEQVRGVHLPIPFSLWLLDPSLPGSDDVFALLEPLLDPLTLSDLRRIRGYRRVEDRLREIESFMNRFNAAMPPQARAIFSADATVPIRQIILQGGLMLWQVAPTEFFSHDGKATFGKIAFHATITAMITMPPELRTRHTLIIDEASEFASEYVMWALGATRKTGLSIWLVAQDRSSFRKGDLDMGPKVTSQCNLVTFQQSDPEDVEVLTKIMRSGELSFKELEHEVQQADGYDWIPVTETSESTQVTANWQESDAEQHGHTHTSAKGKKRGWRTQRSRTKSKQDTQGDAKTRSHPEREPDKAQVSGARNTTHGTGDAESEGDGFEESETETETDAVQSSKTRTKGTGGGVSNSNTVSNKRIPLGKVKLVKQPTGQLERSVSDQREEQMAEMMSSPKRCGFLKIVGERLAVQFRTNDIEAPFDDAALREIAVEHAKQEAYNRHDYYFVPNFDPRQEELKVRRWVALASTQPPAVIQQVAPPLVEESSKALLPPPAHAPHVPQNAPLSEPEENPLA
jgi:hypothetical protein